MELSDYPIRLTRPGTLRCRSRLIATGYRRLSVLANERSYRRLVVVVVVAGARLTEKLDKGNLQVG